MKLLFIKDGKVDNVVTAPLENVEEYKAIILKNGYGKPLRLIDEIREEADDLLVSNGWNVDKKGYSAPEIKEEDLLAEAQAITDQKAELDTKLASIADELTAVRADKANTSTKI